MNYENFDEDGDLMLMDPSITEESLVQQFLPQNEEPLIELSPFQNTQPFDTEDASFWFEEDSSMDESTNSTHTQQQHSDAKTSISDQYQKLRRTMALTEATRAKVIRQLGLSHKMSSSTSKSAAGQRSRLGSMELLLCTHERSGFGATTCSRQ
jgi:hypothetical protein